jgi:hypothetical protein
VGIWAVHRRPTFQTGGLIMSDTRETVKIKGTKEQGGFVLINKEDFDEKTMKLYVEAEPEVDKTVKK